jgi:hypothetical protein
MKIKRGESSLDFLAAAELSSISNSSPMIRTAVLQLGYHASFAGAALALET